MFELLFEPALWGVLAILIGLELALGIDNVVFVSLIMGQVPEEQRERVRRIGLAISVVVQILLLMVMLWIAGVDRVAFTIGGWSPSWSALAFLAGGLFLVHKAVGELHVHIERGRAPLAETPLPKRGTGMVAIIVQVALINAVFSVDTIVTAIGITRSVEAIVAAILITTAIIYFAAGPIAAFIARHQSVRALALAFLLIIGGSLIAEGIGLRPDPLLLYVAIGGGSLVLAIVKLIELRNKDRAAASDAIATREEPVLDAQRVAPEPEQEAKPEPGYEPEPAMETDQEPHVDSGEEVLEEPVPPVQKSAPKRRARRKAARVSNPSPQG
ncbi:TerC family protein [Pelagibacterium limicola]|uniref:TerC family protein n=1 Tax=Pelagibacterium limicola TaxID=2791022 RepID=UPI0018AFDA5A|nr:TerC family protein [Pelagibacterium limicola]